jgi:hypothetical protein
MKTDLAYVATPMLCSSDGREAILSAARQGISAVVQPLFGAMVFGVCTPTFNTEPSRGVWALAHLGPSRHPGRPSARDEQTRRDALSSDPERAGGSACEVD